LFVATGEPKPQSWLIEHIYGAGANAHTSVSEPPELTVGDIVETAGDWEIATVDWMKNFQHLIIKSSLQYFEKNIHSHQHITSLHKSHNHLLQNLKSHQRQHILHPNSK